MSDAKLDAFKLTIADWFNVPVDLITDRERDERRDALEKRARTPNCELTDPVQIKASKLNLAWLSARRYRNYFSSRPAD